MGTMHHNAVIATTWNEKQVDKARAWVAKLPDPWRQLFLFGMGVVNGQQTVVMIPDGSKEGWGESDKGDNYRAEFRSWIAEQAYEDGSNPWDVIEVAFGELGTEVVFTNNPEPA